MKIVAADVFVTCPGRNFVTLKITTDEGITTLPDSLSLARVAILRPFSLMPKQQVKRSRTTPQAR